jgi:hypothetical protein
MRLTFDPHVYRDQGVADEPPPSARALPGIAGELHEAFRATHGEGTPADMVEHVRTLLVG